MSSPRQSHPHDSTIKHDAQLHVSPQREGIQCGGQDKPCGALDLLALASRHAPEVCSCYSQQVLNPTPATCHKRKQKLRCNFGKLRCRSCTAAFAFLQCGCHFDQKLLCNKRKLHGNIEKAALQEMALSRRLPADFRLLRLGAHVWVC